MVKLIVGLKGNGKTKTLIDLVNEAAKHDIGNVICIEKGTKLTYDISHDARLIDISEYGINNYESLFAFICGLFAGNYDITSLFINGIFKICSEDKTGLTDFINKLENISGEDKKIVITVSADQSETDDSLKRFFA